VRSPVILVLKPLSPPVIDAVISGELQVKDIPEGMTPAVGVTAKLTPLHVVKLIESTDAMGLTVTVTVNGSPVQVKELGVTI